MHCRKKQVMTTTKSNPAHIPIRNFNSATHLIQLNSKCHANEVMPTYAKENALIQNAKQILYALECRETDKIHGRK